MASRTNTRTVHPDQRHRWRGFGAAQRLAADFVDDGWLSPDTYMSHFEEPCDGSAVYAFVILDRESLRLGRVAYVGMSTCLIARWAAHPILRILRAHSDYSVFRWFKPLPTEDLRSVEASLIRKFDPPWNIIGRERGV